MIRDTRSLPVSLMNREESGLAMSVEKGHRWPLRLIHREMERERLETDMYGASAVATLSLAAWRRWLWRYWEKNDGYGYVWLVDLGGLGRRVWEEGFCRVSSFFSFFKFNLIYQQFIVINCFNLYSTYQQFIMIYRDISILYIPL